MLKKPPAPKPQPNVPTMADAAGATSLIVSPFPTTQTGVYTSSQGVTRTASGQKRSLIGGSL